ncbi:precorrin-3B synthase [Nocardia jinanensis]|uniref:Precorrin-3B synthase n=1 Tax=Nocardia jinanensis TaxID=382504 RepID=A0A917R6Q6_9NOCA|nr:precorrin-3B synthase [Nocardia jinanensis]GGK92307.1 precorrin-3B synthase [Nocardia jinanensis]
MARTDPDSCPGVLRLHEAADGPLARVRVPGGTLTPEQLQTLAAAAHDLADGAVELTSRGNIQLRRIRDTNALAERLAAAGLLPSRTHERVRNIIASPLSGRVGDHPDIRPLVAALDTGLLGSPRLAALPGRVLFTLDDGRGDVSPLRPDIGLHALGGDRSALLLAGRDSGIRVTGTDAAEVLLAAAHGFLELADRQWRLHEVEDGVARLTALLGLEPGPDRLEFTGPADPPIGWLPQHDDLVALGAGVRLGSLPARTAEFLAAVERPILLTPWRSLIVTDLEEGAAEQVVRVLAPMGLIFDATSPWLRITACAGQPGCAKSHTDIRADAAAAVESGRTDSPGTGSDTPIPAGEITTTGRQHWSGCERRCGRPTVAVTEVTATPEGYRVALPRD